jgi:hypothetical protein
MRKLIFLFFLLFSSNFLLAQFDKPVFQLGFGIVEPHNEFKGGDYYRYSNFYRYNTPYIDTTYYFIQPLIMPDENLFSTRYAAKTGMQIFGTAKINFDKYSITRGVATINYNFFNVFEPQKTGLDLAFVNYLPYQVPVTYNYSFDALSLGLGFEVAPLSFTNLVSPFINANFNFNFLGAKLTKVGPYNDSTTFEMSDFRLGLSLSGGIEINFNKQWGIVLGYKYDWGNLLLKNTEVGGFQEWGRTNASINDETGSYISNLYGARGDSYKTYNSSKKDINWGTFYIGANFYPNFASATPKKK